MSGTEAFEGAVELDLVAVKAQAIKVVHRHT
jgi:hypothetical protein